MSPCYISVKVEWTVYCQCVFLLLPNQQHQYTYDYSATGVSENNDYSSPCQMTEHSCQSLSPMLQCKRGRERRAASQHQLWLVATVCQIPALLQNSTGQQST